MLLAINLRTEPCFIGFQGCVLVPGSKLQVDLKLQRLPELLGFLG